MNALYMRRALELAKKGYTRPNPMVGAVIVKDGKIISEGYHKRAGMPHAERMALEGVDAQGATLYVTLEPCSHHGRTPPCTDAIIQAGIRKVVCAMRDPNPKVSGIKILRDAGIEVDVGLMEKEARSLNEAFIFFMENNRPFILSKCAASLDGKIATSSGESKWISSPDSRLFTRSLRGRYGAICVGIGTVLSDDPSLDTPEGPDPLRVILDNTLSLPLDAKVLRDSNVLVATSDMYNRDAMISLQEKGIEVEICGDECVDLGILASKLAKRGIISMMIEGGSEVHASAFASGLVDKVLFVYSPRIIGGRKAPGMVGGDGVSSLKDSSMLHNISISRIGDDIVIEGYVQRRS